MKQFSHTNFDRAFRPDEVFECPERGRITVRQVEVADLFLPSGRLAACDPSELMSVSAGVPFSRLAPRGRHRVHLCLAKLKYKTRGEERVACAMVRFTPAPAAKWEMAVLPDQNVEDLRGDEVFGYGVDAGLGCFVDAEAAEKLSDEEAEDLYFNRLLKELQKGKQFKNWAELVIDPATGANLVAFSSGYGDGFYPSFWGVDESGELCCLVTDFGILLKNLEGAATFRLGDSIGQTLAHPDFYRLGMTVRVVPSDSDQNLRLETEGANCEVVVTNKGNKCLPHRSQLQVADRIYSHDLWFLEPLSGDSTLTIRYSLGTQAL